MKTIEHKTAFISKEADGIIWVRIKEDVVIELEDAKEYIKTIMTLCEGIPHNCIIDTRSGFLQMSNETRKYIGTDEEALRYRLADAVLVKSLPIRLIANFFAKNEAPKHPVKIFNDEESAKNWLSTLK